MPPKAKAKAKADSEVETAAPMAPKAKAKGKAKAEPEAEPTSTRSLNIFPPEATTTGKRYYVHYMANQTKGNAPFVAVGNQVALHFMGGNWFGGGQSPKGFANLEDACNDLVRKVPDADVVLKWQVPDT